MLKKLVCPVVAFLSYLGAQGQCDPLVSPQLFGPSTTSIFCKNESIPIGVFYSDTVGTAKYYYFSKFVNGVETSRKGGPLVGNGGQLSVSTAMRSAGDYGEYRVTTVNQCGASSYSSFYAFYGSIDNLSISSWGNNAVTFRWAACGPLPAVTYEYAVSPRSDPNLVGADSIFTTTDTSVTVTGLVAGVTYYIHVRLNSVFWNNAVVEPSGFGFGCNQGNYVWQSIRFVSCSGGSQVLGAASPANAPLCAGTATITAPSGNSYQWYREDNSAIAGQTSSTYNATSAGQYRAYITTGTVCQGMAASATIYQQSLQQPTAFFGAGDFYSGDTVRLAIRSTVAWQTYKILKDGVEVYSFQGVGYSIEAAGPDTQYYKFVITSLSQAGLYKVRVVSPYCPSVDFGSAQVNLVSGVTICPNANTSFTFSSPGNNTNFQWQVDNNTGSGFVNIVNGGVYSTANTKTLTITGAPLSMYGYKYRCNATGGTPVTSSIRTLKFGPTWVGGATGSPSSWTTAANWSCNLVPDNTLDIIIPVTTSQLIIGSNVSCRSVFVQTGAHFTVNTGFKLTITGQ